MKLHPRREGQVKDPSGTSLKANVIHQSLPGQFLPVSSYRPMWTGQP